MTMGLSEGISPSPAPPLPVGPPSGAPMDEEGQPGPSGGPPRTPRDEDTCSEASSMSTDELMSPAEKLQAAINLKDEGNALFKEGQYEQALERYKAGVKHVKGSQDSDAIAVSVQLSSNSCMCCLKLERWQQAITAANQVLATEPKNPKALYRRAVAKSNLGELSDAKDDLMAVIAIDKANAEARKELQKIREKIQAAKAEDKKAYSGLFSRASGLYDDREEARERRKKEEEAERARKRAEWEKDMAARKGMHCLLL
ncbi:hypothetical protein ETH_00032030 [Eimeria tenella]|uniref:Uncharacterized protein n=1 Tax=Eimeria tenella TaxID=5802 RepID=U6KX86_EIMTE|nr:hypothetical protein ETH_00032030 [Eimeria tenella]CDJ42772.1 hypothetical protein ETH_00032030 [Eimeria tenella]|eukprot:XP_013233522.1 hypothetical protein ETH_00032030 [Eimeria tenella]